MAGSYDPVNPVAYGAAIFHPYYEAGIAGGQVLSSVVGDNYDLFTEVRRMWIAPGDVVADVTYGRGAFWKQPAAGEVPQIRHEIDPEIGDGVDCRALPEPDESIDVVVFDPPYRAAHGGTQVGGDKLYPGYNLPASNLDSTNDVLNLYRDGIKEAARVLKPGGRIMVKCQDLSYSSRLHLTHLDVLRHMVSAGLDLVDMFVLVNNKRAPINKAAKRQERARRAHSYLLIGAKAQAVDESALTKVMDKLNDKYGFAAVEAQFNRLVSEQLANGKLG